MEGDKARDQDCALVPCRASLAIVQMKTKRMSNTEQRAVRGQHMVQVVCRQQWKQCDTDSGESSSNMYATPPDSMAIVRVQGVAVIVDCNEENERDGLLVRVQGCDRRLRRGQLQSSVEESCSRNTGQPPRCA